MTMTTTNTPARALAAALAGLIALQSPAVMAHDFDRGEVSQGWNGDGDSWQHGRRHHQYRGSYGYNQRAYYDEPVYRDTRTWRGQDGRYYCRKKNGTTGLIIGGAAGALIGRSMDRGYDRTLGTVLGAAGGALLGREIDRNGSRCR